MGLFNNYLKEGKGVSKEQNTPRFILFFQIYFRKFWNLISLNLLYIAFCIPIITIGPATAAMTKILRNYAREEHAFLWGDFLETFKKNFKQGFLYWLLDLFVTVFLIFDLMCVAALPNKMLITICTAGILFALVVTTFMRYYVYSMMVTFKLNLRQLLKNAFIFCWAAFFKNILLTALIIIITWLMVFKMNFFLLLFLIATLYFSTFGLLINFMVNPTIKKYMIDGYDPQTGEKLEEEKYDGFDEPIPDELD